MLHKSAVLILTAFSLSACGGGGGSNTSSSTATIVTNNTPVLANANDDQQAFIGFDFSYDAGQAGLTFSDSDSSSLTYTVTLNPARNDLSVSEGVISGTPLTPGNVNVTISASDGNSSASDTFALSITVKQDALTNTFGASIDLENLANYAAPAIPSYIRPANTVLNPVTDSGATLGRVLFYDPALSTNDTVSCASCHRQNHAFSDPRVVSRGVGGGQTGRHSMRLINTIYSDEPSFFWDERAANLEDQVTRPIRDHNEHGFSGENGRPDFDDLITKLEAIEYYQELFAFVFQDTAITEARIQSALAQFVNSIVSFDSKFDAGFAQALADNPNADPSDPFDAVYFSPFANFTADENAGKNLYMTGPQDLGAGCMRCHAQPVFSVFENSGHIGVTGVPSDPSAVDLTNVRAPSLRDVFKPNGNTNGPFMHDGSMTTMREVIDHYEKIPVPTTEPARTEFMATIDPQVVQFDDTENLNLTNQEKSQLEAFLLTLTGQTVYTEAKWSNPF